ncbi:MAG: histone deacetylase [Anaerolineae bacterium]|nr:histone deacetylase [Anaerolineae bacterium]
MTTLYATHPRYTEHDLESHPEHAGRIRAIWRALDDSGLSQRMQRAVPEPVTDAQILYAHTPDYLDLLRKSATLTHTVRFDPDTYCNPTSFEIARLSAGGVVSAVDAVLRGDAANGLAAVRPPGHHAVPGRAMGFCLLGNVAIGARQAQRVHGVERVLIVDIDVHHGNGTEAIFYDDPSVLFVSTHQSVSAFGTPFYPGTGAIGDTGVGGGVGATINIPLPPGHGDDSYAALFDRVIAPAARRFKPEFMLVSVGFDAHWVDPLAGMRLSLAGYAHLSRALKDLAHELCGGRIVFVVEGGYNLDALSNGVANVARILLDDPEIVDPLGPPDDGLREPDIEPLIAQLRELHELVE